MDFSGLQTRWQTLQDEAISFYDHTAVVSYRPVYSGTDASYDQYFAEGLDGNDPGSFSGVTTTTGTATVTGIALVDIGALKNMDPVAHMQIGRFEPADAVFTCKISDATVSGENVFSRAEFVTLSVDNERYIVERIAIGALKDPYVYHVLLKRSNI